MNIGVIFRATVVQAIVRLGQHSRCLLERPPKSLTQPRKAPIAGTSGTG